MNKIVFILLITTTSFSQVTNRIPLNNGEIIYSEVIEAKGKTKDQLYSTVKYFFADDFKSSNDVIQLDDKENGVVLGKGNSSINIRSKNLTVPIKVNFTLKVSFKDDKCKIEMYNLIYSGSIPAEQMFNKDADARYIDKKTKPHIREIMDDYIDGTNKVFLDLKNNLVAKLNEKQSEW